MLEMVKTVIRSREEPEGKCSTNKGECTYLRPRGTQGKIFLLLHLLTQLYFGCFTVDLDKVLKRCLPARYEQKSAKSVIPEINALYLFLLYRHESFTGKYTTRKIHKN